MILVRATCFLAFAPFLWLACCTACSGHDASSVIDEAGNVAPWALGVADAEATVAVMDLAALGPEHALAAVPTPELLAARGAVLAMEVAAVPSIGQLLRNGGCAQPGGAELASAMEALVPGRGFEAATAVAVVDLALQAALSLPPEAGPDTSSWDAVVGALPPPGPAADEVVRARADALLDTAPGAMASHGRRICADRAMDVVRSLDALDKVGDGSLLRLVEKHLATLPAGDPRGLDLVSLIDAAAPQDRPDAARMEELALDGRLHPEARALACAAAIRRRSPLEQMRADLGALPAPVMRCLVTQASSTDWWDAQIPRGALGHGDLAVRLGAIEGVRHQADGADFELLRRRMEARSPTEPVPGLREQAALLRAAAEVLLLRSEVREAALEKVVDDELGARILQRIEITEDQRPPSDRLVEANCDDFVPPALGAAGLAAAITRAADGATVCAAEGRYEGDLRLETPGARLLALAPGRTILAGHLVVDAPAAVAGLQVEGSLLVGPAAGGSVLLAVRAGRESLVETGDALLVDVASRAGLHGPWPGFGGSMHVAPGSSRLLARLGDRVETVGSRGSASGWIDLAALAPLLGIDLWKREPPIRRRFVPVAPGPWDMLAASGLALTEPDRFQAAPLGRWAPIYGQPASPGSPVLALPLAPAPWQASRANVLISLAIE